MTQTNEAFDGDLESLTRGELVKEVMRLRQGIRRHQDSTGHDLCWYHPDLWGLLPEVSDPLPEVPAWPQFLRGCIHYRQSIDRQLPEERFPRRHIEHGDDRRIDVSRADSERR